MVALEEKSGDHQSQNHPLETMDVCAEFHNNPCNSYWDISVWMKMVDRQTDTAIPKVILPAWLKKYYLHYLEMFS